MYAKFGKSIYRRELDVKLIDPKESAVSWKKPEEKLQPCYLSYGYGSFLSLGMDFVLTLQNVDAVILLTNNSIIIKFLC